MVKPSKLPSSFNYCMSCTPIEIKLIVTIVTFNSIPDIMIPLTFIVVTQLINDLFVFSNWWCRCVRVIALGTSDLKFLHTTHMLFLFSFNACLQGFEQVFGWSLFFWSRCYELLTFAFRIDELFQFFNIGVRILSNIKFLTMVLLN
jgi:hypothetical protein